MALHGFGPLATRLDLSRIRLLHNSQADQGTALRAHLQDLGINPDQPDAHSLALVDLVYTATCRDQEVYVLCKVSLTVEHDGFTRARDRSRTLTRLTGKPTLATVIGTALGQNVIIQARENSPPEAGDVAYVPVYRD